MLGSLPILPDTAQTTYEPARIRAQLEAAGKMIGTYDLIVAAPTLERAIAETTFNQRHFGSVTVLTIIEPQ